MDAVRLVFVILSFLSSMSHAYVGSSPLRTPVFGRLRVISSRLTPLNVLSAKLNNLSLGGRRTALGAVLDKVKDLVADQLGVDKEKISPTSSFVSDLGADSLDSVELVMALEEKFGVEIPDEEAHKITTVQQAVDYIEKTEIKS